jgi:hypothetical protein
LAGQGLEAEHADLDVPDTGREIQGVAAILVRIGHDLGAALRGGNGGAGDKLVGGSDRAAVFYREKQSRGQQGNGNYKKTHEEALFLSSLRDGF